MFKYTIICKYNIKKRAHDAFHDRTFMATKENVKKNNPQQRPAVNKAIPVSEKRHLTEVIQVKHV